MSVKGSEYLLVLNQVIEELPSLDKILSQIQSDLNPQNSSSPSSLAIKAERIPTLRGLATRPFSLTSNY